MKLLFKKLTATAQIPQKANRTDAGYDLYADLGLGEKITLYAGTRLLIHTSIAVVTPPGTYMRVAPRSGLAFKNGIDVLAGVIDEGYRDGVGVILLNTGTSNFVITHGDRIAQGIIEMLAPIEEVVEVTGDLPPSDRGTGGFGSTGR